MAGISPWQQTPEEDFVVMCPENLDLSGGDVTHLFVAAPTKPTWGNDTNAYSLIIKEWIIMYTENMAAAGVGSLLRLGKPANSSAFHDFTPPDGKVVGDVDIVLNTSFNGEDRVTPADGAIQIRNIGNLGAAGEVRVGVKLSYRYDQYKDFDGYGL